MEGFRTSDIYFAAYLLMAEVPMLGTEQDGRRTIFVFEDQGKIAMRSLKNGYYSDGAKVHVLSFVQRIKQVKRLLSSSSPDPRGS